jgi:hypothetical protein
MSWSFYHKDHPKEVRARADSYFSQPYIGTMQHGERMVALLAHAQIVAASEGTVPGYDMNVSAYGSTSTSGNDGVTHNVNVTISFEKQPDPASEADKSKAE